MRLRTKDGLTPPGRETDSLGSAESEGEDDDETLGEQLSYL